MSTHPESPLSAALQAAVEVGIAPVDAARIAGVPIPTQYSETQARTGAYFVRWFRQGELTGLDTDGRRVWSTAGWHIAAASPNPQVVPAHVRGAFAELLAVAPPRSGAR